METKQNKEWMTVATQQRLQAELAELEQRLAQEGERVREIAADTTWHGSNEVIPSLTREMSDLTRRIGAIKLALKRASIYDPSTVPLETVALGARVRVSEDGELEEYTIVGHMETDPARGCISTDSPLGRALIGHRAGDTVEVQTPDGSYALRIEAINRAL